MKKYKYVVAFKGQYFSVKGGYRAYKRFVDIIGINKHNSLIECLEVLKLNDIHYTLLNKSDFDIKKGDIK